jgi:hypothetical protein
MNLEQVGLDALMHAVMVNPSHCSLPNPHFIARILIGLLLIMCPVVPLATAQPPASSFKEDKKPKADSSNDLGKLTVKELIDKLQGESEEGIASHTNIWTSGFPAGEEKTQFLDGSSGARKPNASPIMRELMHRGLAALPELIDHLGDNRTTKLAIPGQQFISGMWHNDEYDARYLDPKKKPSEVNTLLEVSKKTRFEREYTLRVGDLCFVAIGEIVNRRLSAVRGQPTACIVINSPVQTTTLAAAVKSDWAGLTVEQHKQSLSRDALSIHPYATPAAMERLLFYYPKEGEALAWKLLARPVYDHDALWDFIMKRLVKEDDPTKWKALIDEFRSKHGQASVDALPLQLHWIYWITDFERDKEFLEGKDRASKILARFYPSYDPNTPSFVNAATSEERFLVVETLLISKRKDQKFRDSTASRIKALEALPKDSGGRHSLEGLYLLQDRLKKLDRNP